jgi:tetratricopeptide (TPR) repeat protein
MGDPRRVFRLFGYGLDATLKHGQIEPVDWRFGEHWKRHLEQLGDRTMRRRLNTKLFICLLIALVAMGTGVHFLHAYQVRRSAGDLLDEAAIAEEEGRNADAAKLLNHYLGYVPDDVDALARYGLVLDKLPPTQNIRLRAFLVFDQVLRLDPGRTDVRRRLVSLAMEGGRYDDAVQHLEMLKERPPKDAELEELHGQCFEAKKELEKAADQYEMSKKIDPARISAYKALARVGRQLDPSNKTADEVMDELVMMNSKSSRALVIRAVYHMERGSLDKAEKDLADARDKLQAAEEADVLWASAEVARARKKLGDARGFLEKGVQLYPDNEDFYISLAQLEADSGKHEAGIAWLRRGLKESPDNAKLFWSLTELLAQSKKPGDLKEAEGNIKQMRDGGSTNPLVDYLDARLHVTTEEWHEASQILEKLNPVLAKLPELQEKAEMLLAQCYEQLGDADQQYEVCQRVLRQNPASQPASRGKGAALLALGKVDQARESYERLNDPLLGARLRILRTMALPVKQRGSALKEVDQLLTSEAKKGDVPLVQIAILRAQILVAQARYDEARQLLTEARDKKPDEVAYWAALAALIQDLGKPEDALKVLADAEKQLRDCVELRLARATYWVRKIEAVQRLKQVADTFFWGDLFLLLVEEEATQGLMQVTGGADNLDPKEQLKLWRGLTEMCSQLGKTAEAITAGRRVVELAPRSLNGWLLLFDLNLQAGDEAGMKRALKKIEEIEGPEGTLGSYGKIVHLTFQAEREQDEDVKRKTLDEAHRLATSLAKRRQGWARVALAEAHIHDLARKPEQAITCYQRAITLGERSRSVLKRLLQLLSQSQRYMEADQILHKLPEQALRSSDLERFAVVASVRSNDITKAADLAKDISKKSNDYRDFIWLGQILLAAKRPAEDVEKAFRDAVRMKETAPDAWLALLQYQVRTNQTKAAELTIREAEKKIPPNQLPLAMAQCLELTGHMKEAGAQYKAALDAKPNDSAILRAAALFALRDKPTDKAEQYLRELLAKGVDDANWAGRLLAVVLASSSDQARSKEALKMLGLSSERSPWPITIGDSASDTRLKAIVLAAQKSYKTRVEAIELLEKLSERQPLEPEDQFLLATLNVAARNWGKARPLLLALAASHPENHRYLRQTILLLLHDKNVEGAKVWLTKLEKIQDAPKPATVELKARVLHDSGDVAKAIALLNEYSQTKDAQLEFVARLFEEYREYDGAKKVFRRLAAEVPTPENALAFAEFLGRRGEVDQALGVWEQTRDKYPKYPLEKSSLSAVVILYASKDKAKGDPCRRVSQWLESEIQKYSAQKDAHALVTVLLERKAAIYNLEGLYSDAERVYRTVVSRDPKNAVCINNLAWLILWNSSNEAEALKLVNGAMDVVGREPSLLDTRGVIFLALGQHSNALNDLQEAAKEKPTASVIFHLARAYLALQNRDQALAELDRAENTAIQEGPRRGLSETGLSVFLHPLEYKTYGNVNEDLRRKK